RRAGRGGSAIPFKAHERPLREGLFVAGVLRQILLGRRLWRQRGRLRRARRGKRRAREDGLWNRGEQRSETPVAARVLSPHSPRPERALPSRLASPPFDGRRGELAEQGLDARSTGGFQG